MTESNHSHGSPAITFEDSLAYVLTSTMSLLGMAPFYEGFDAWINTAYVALSPELRSDIHLIFYPFGAPLIYEQLRRNPPPSPDSAAIAAWLSAIPEQAIRESVAASLQTLANDPLRTGHSRPIPSIEDAEALGSFLEQSGCRWWEFEHTTKDAFDDLVRVLQNPAAFRARIVLDVTRFWDAHFRAEYAKCRPTLAESVKRGRNAAYEKDFVSIVSRVTGRPVPEAVVERCGATERLTFVPSCHAGPYVNYVSIGPAGTELVITFNALLSRHTAQGEPLSARAMFAPLKALSDETRLEIVEMLRGTELYAQQIVDRLSLSQPSVSRHLRLMVAAQILIERQDEKMKYYRINTEMLAHLERTFSALVRGESDRRAEDAP